jgi:methyltransferase (TIGR00027 family)
MRAAHQLFDPAPRLLEDPLAITLIGETGVQQIKAAADRYLSPPAAALRSHVVLRTRHTEQRLQAALERGVTQYVILGAGLDTFALRQPDWAQGLDIIEVDHPATQAVKKNALSAAGLALPANARFADIDFERESLRDGLLRNKVALDRRTFFSWLGVTMYLTQDAIDSVLQLAASCPAGSEITLTYAQPLEPGGSDALSMLARMTASLGEPWLSFFTPAAVEEKLRKAGFSTVEFLTPEAAAIHYFTSTTGSLPVPRQTNIVSAVI